MSPLSFLRSVYTLDTLDTRFTTSSVTSYKTVIDSRGEENVKDAQKEKIASRAEPSKWNTPEFYLYLGVVFTCVPLMLWIPYTVSRRMTLWYSATLSDADIWKPPTLGTGNMNTS